MPSDSRDDLRRDQSSTTPSVSPLTSFIHQVFAIPRTIYQRGVERGDEWRQRRNHCHRDIGSSCDQTYREGSWQRQQGQPNYSDSSSHSTSFQGNGDDEGDDWISWFKGEIARREQRAKEIYDSWEKPTTEESKTDQQESDGLEKQMDHLHKPSKRVHPIDELEKQLGFMYELEKSQERAIVEKLLGTSIDPVKSMDTAKTLEELGACAKPDCATHSILWDILPHLVATAMQSWDPEDASVTSYMATYAVASPYSPIYLENQPGFDRTWRARFEDLFRAEQGQSLLTKEEITIANNQKPEEWLRSLNYPYRGQADCPFQRPLAFSKPHDDAETEYDAYHNITNRSEESYLKEAIKRHRLSFEKNWSYPQDDSVDNSSTVTSVTRTVNSYTEPDGSLTRKTVVHRIFQDGREETSENIEKKPAPFSSHAGNLHKNTRKEIEPALNSGSLRETEQPRRGWFWSK